MIVITRWRPIPTGQPMNFDKIVDEILHIRKYGSAKIQSIEGLESVEMFYNESGSEIVSIDKMKNFSVLDKMEADKVNNEVGLRMVKLGFGITSMEILRELDDLKRLQNVYRGM